MLESLILIYEKRADQDAHKKNKGRYVAVGGKRIDDGYEKYYDRLSPMVIADNIFFVGTIEANKNQAMSTIYVRNAFIKADNDEQIRMLLSDTDIC